MNKTVIALGFFDGVHLGHQRILAEGRAIADRQGLPLLALTFENQPRAFLRGERPDLIMSRQQRERALRQAGADQVVMTPFDWGVAVMTPEDFVTERLIKEYNCAAVVCGMNYTFGAMGKGNGQLLKTMGDRLGFQAWVCPPVEEDGRPVSSSWVRSVIAQGDMKTAARLLGRPYTIEGVVSHGRRVGTGMGYPTGNFPLMEDMLKPRFGVYAARVKIEDKIYPCALNVGVRPTFGLTEAVAEFNVLDFSGDLYGRRLELELIDFIRPEIKFDSQEELAAQIGKDVQRIKEALK